MRLPLEHPVRGPGYGVRDGFSGAPHPCWADIAVEHQGRLGDAGQQARGKLVVRAHDEGLVGQGLGRRLHGRPERLAAHRGHVLRAGLGRFHQEQLDRVRPPARPDQAVQLGREVLRQPRRAVVDVVRRLP